MRDRCGLLLLLVLLAGSGFAESTYAMFRVARVTDGDTIRILVPSRVAKGELRYETVRLIGINAPERSHFRKPAECYSDIAGDQLRLLIEGKDVRVYRLDHDNFGRRLGYVYMPDGQWPVGSARRPNNSLNLYMVANGYARAERRFPHRYMKSYVLSERTAQASVAGLWGNCK